MFSLKKFILLKAFIIVLFTQNLLAVTLTVLPFTSKEESFEKEYAVKDGIPRLLSEELASFKRAEVSDYDFVIAYFSAEDIVEPYSILSTNIERAISFTSNIFNSDYILNGTINDFTLETNENESKAIVSISINIIEVKTGISVSNIDTSIEKKGNIEKKIYKSEDAYFYESLLGKATKEALIDLSKNIIETIKSPSPKGVITRIENKKMYINLGENDSVKQGDIFEIFKTEKQLMLPKEDIAETNVIITNTFDFSNTHIIIDNGERNTNYTDNISNKEPPQPKGYLEVRTNISGDLWYTSETLYQYRFYRDIETYIGEASVIEVFKNYAVLSNLVMNTNTNNNTNANTNANIEFLMRVRLKKRFDKDKK